MKYDLKKPCGNCPFRTDCLPGWLGEESAERIATAITDLQQTFSCHKTDRGANKEETTQHCGGALIMLEKMGQPNQMMRIAERLGFYDRSKLDMNAPVFDDTQEFIDHHA